MMKVRKAVFPAAGLGTRFLPATKAQPKEMLPLVDKPIIQYGVEEALSAGCDQNHHYHRPGQAGDRDHFDVSYELEKMLEEKGKTDLLQIVRQISDMIHVAYVRQKEALGLGHACSPPANWLATSRLLYCWLMTSSMRRCPFSSR